MKVTILHAERRSTQRLGIREKGIGARPVIATSIGPTEAKSFLLPRGESATFLLVPTANEGEPFPVQIAVQAEEGEVVQANAVAYRQPQEGMTPEEALRDARRAPDADCLQYNLTLSVEPGKAWVVNILNAPGHVVRSEPYRLEQRLELLEQRVDLLELGMREMGIEKQDLVKLAQEQQQPAQPISTDDAHGG